VLRTFSKGKWTKPSRGDLPCVTGIADGIVVYGYNIDFSDDDVNLRAVLQRARAFLW